MAPSLSREPSSFHAGLHPCRRNRVRLTFLVPASRFVGIGADPSKRTPFCTGVGPLRAGLNTLLQKGEVLAYVGRNNNLKDLKCGVIALAGYRLAPVLGGRLEFDSRSSGPQWICHGGHFGRHDPPQVCPHGKTTPFLLSHSLTLSLSLSLSLSHSLTLSLSHSHLLTLSLSLSLSSKNNFFTLKNDLFTSGGGVRMVRGRRRRRRRALGGRRPRPATGAPFVQGYLDHKKQRPPRTLQ